MNITRRTFLAATTAFVSVNLFVPIASAPIDPEHLQRDRWYQAWFQPKGKPPIRTCKLSGVSRLPAPHGSFLPLDTQTMPSVKTARHGGGLRHLERRTVNTLPQKAPALSAT